MEHNFFQISLDDIPALESYLHGQRLVDSSVQITRLEKAGEGNMNCTLRLLLSDRSSLIVKQGRPWVEKYPDIPAPWGRTAVEAQFLRLVAKNPKLRTFSPHCDFIDTENQILVLEDLGMTRDGLYLYSPGEALTDVQYETLLSYLSELHKYKVPSELCAGFANRDMRNLNAQHIFDIPFTDAQIESLDQITAGLTAAAKPIAAQAELRSRIGYLKSQYLRDVDYLLHGDFYPGSWLFQKERVYVIDPEFCFMGVREFDLGVMLAHLAFAGLEGEPSLDVYLENHMDINLDLVRGFAGIEIMRRLLGVAQLPLNIGLEPKKQLLQKAQQWISLI